MNNTEQQFKAVTRKEAQKTPGYWHLDKWAVINAETGRIVQTEYTESKADYVVDLLHNYYKKQGIGYTYSSVPIKD